MTACIELDALLAERAAGPLAPEDEARVAGHLEGCAGCRGVLREYEQVFELVGGPSPRPSPRERGEGEGEGSLAPGTLARWKRRERRRITGLALGSGFAAAAAAAALVLAPAFLTRRAHPPPAEVAQSTWESDADAALDASALSYASEGSSDEITTEDAALAAFDEAARP